MPKLILTDLDGSFLDHDDYSYAAAAPALARIETEGIPLIFVTSKTRSEVEALQERLGIRWPFVVENGAASFFPADMPRPWVAGGSAEPPVDDPPAAFRVPAARPLAGYGVLRYGVPYAEVRAFVEAARDRFGIRGFGDMSVDEVTDLTGLPGDDAVRAKRREFTEPFLLGDPLRLDALIREAAAHGLGVTTGGRLFHLMGLEQSKGRAARELQRVFAANTGLRVESIGLGDSANDLSLLEAVDHPVVIPRPDGTTLALGRPDALTAPAPGSGGWNAAVLVLLGREPGAGEPSARPTRSNDEETESGAT